MISSLFLRLTIWLSIFVCIPQVALAEKKLTIGTVNNSDMIRMQRLAKEFRKIHPGIELEWIILEENELRERLTADITNRGGQFDIMTIGMYEAPLWGQKGWLSALNSISEDYDVGDIFPSLISGLSIGGQLYALPFYAESSMTYYRKDLFKEQRIEMPAQPTWDDIRTFAQTLHAPEKQQYGICLRGKPGWGENIALITTMSNAFGGRWFDVDWQPEFTRPAWRKSFGFYIDLLQNYGPPEAANMGFNENLAYFNAGKCAIWVDATVAGSFINNDKQSTVANNVDYALAPKQVTSRGAGWLWAWALAVPTTSREQELAKSFIAWATSKEYVQLVAKTYGIANVPPGTRASTYNNPAYIEAAPFAARTLEAMNKADPRIATLHPVPYVGIQFVGIPEFQKIATEVGKFFAAALTQSKTPTQALANAQRYTYQAMKQANYHKPPPSIMPAQRVPEQ